MGTCVLADGSSRVGVGAGVVQAAIAPAGRSTAGPSISGHEAPLFVATHVTYPVQDLL
jgi:hypothetical protein